MNFLKTYIIIVFALLSRACFSQEADERVKIDALKDDTIKVFKYVVLSHGYSTYNFKESIIAANKALELSEKLHYLKGKDDAYSALADAYWYHSDYEKAQDYYFKSYKLNDSIHNTRGIAYDLYNIGWILCIQQHNYKEDHYLYKSYGIYTSLKDTTGLLMSFNAMGSYYSDRYTNTGQKQFFDSALKYFNLGINTAIGHRHRHKAGDFFSNMADLYAGSGDYTSAIFYNERGALIHKEMNDTSATMMDANNKANYLTRLKQYKEAIPLFKKVMSYCEQHDLTDLKSTSVLGLANCNEGLGNYKEAYMYSKLYSHLQDTLNKQMYSTNLREMQSVYDLGKAEASVKELKQVSEIQELKNKQSGYFIFILIGVAIVVMVVAILLFRQNKQKQSANTLLREQNNIIAEKKHEIENSIQYAKGIQNALLPDLSDLKDVFPESFVFYQPKDVVSGDFYWFQKIDQYFYCIAADCTGHGVPGALMSIIGIDKIVQAIFEKKIMAPGDILSFLNKEIKNVLKQRNDEAKQKDGMDIALLRFNLNDQTVDYAAANRPLYIIRHKELMEYKADKVAIAGFTPQDQEYRSTTVQLQVNDSVFIFSDGYADQFGGESGKKFMTKNMKDLFIKIAETDTESQFEKTRSTFFDWKKEYEQVDDVLVIGIKIT